MSNCMERSIFARQISKHGLQQRVVDEQLIDANVTQKELENLIAYDEYLDIEPSDIDTSKWNIEDDLLREIALNNPKLFAECPFLHESLMLESEEQLSAEEKMEAEILYEREKKGLLYSTHGSLFDDHSSSNINNSSNVSTTFNGLPVFLQNSLSNMYASSVSSMPQVYGRNMSVASYTASNNNGDVSSLPMSAQQRQPFNMQALSSNPPRINPRSVNKSAHVIQSRRITVDESLILNSVTKPGSKMIISKGDSVLVVRTATGSVYLRDDFGQIADAMSTKYAQPLPTPQPQDVIELD